LDLTILQLGLYFSALFAAAVVAGVTGFAFALIAAAVWLHILTPLQTATLTISYGLIVQSYGFWKMRHAFKWNRFWPYVLGSAPGIAMGVQVLRVANPAYIRMGIATFLALYAIYGLARPALKPIHAGTAADIAVGFVSGMFGAMAGFPGIIIVIWCTLRGWPRDVQRGVFQPVSVALLAMSAIGLAATGSIALNTIYLFLAGLPVLALGTWVGFRLYGKVDDEMFRKIVLWLLLVAGVFLMGSVLR
jgi:uncharacterized membrane protein YfcA